ncbi:MAG: MCE family protein [Muribaculaceae bacterium]|nr:MCE family protein [Muribaculaceae bacterium]
MKKNIIIGLVVILGLAFLYWGIEFLKGVNLFEPSNYYIARFEKINGLNVSSPITVNGFQVGLVREINFDYKTNEIEVKMSLDDDLKIPVGSSVSLSSELLGGSSLILNLAKAQSYYKVGDLIPSNTKAGLMDKVGTDIMPQVNEIMPKVNDIVSNVDALVANPALRNSVSDFDDITSKLNASASDLKVLMTNLSALSNNLNGSVPGVINGFAGIETKVDGTMSNIQTLSSNLNNKVNDLPTEQLQTTINDLNATLANLKALTSEINQKLNDRNSSLGLLLNDRQLYDNANGAVMSLDSLLNDMKAHPKKYITIKVF